MSGWAVAHVGTKHVGKTRPWCAGVWPMPADCLRNLKFEFGLVLSFECLVFPEIGGWALICLRTHLKRMLERQGLCLASGLGPSSNTQAS